MKAYRIGSFIIAADSLEEAQAFLLDETGEPVPLFIEELEWLAEIRCEDGSTATVKVLVNRMLDERSAWLRLGVPCELYYPFFLVKGV